MISNLFKLFSLVPGVSNPKASTRKNLNSIAFLGASVTAQTIERESGALTGYVEAFRRNHAPELDFESVLVNAYPGNRISDAGLIAAKDVMRHNPDVLVLELIVEDRSMGIDFDDRHLNHLCNLCAAHGAIPVFLALPEPGKRDPYEDTSYQRIARFTDANDLLLCVIELPEDAEISEYYRDGIHTNTKGAVHYAKCLAEFIHDISEKGWPIPTKKRNRFNFEINRIPEPKTKIFRTIIIRNDLPKNKSGSISILQNQSIGPHSPMVDVEVVSAKGTSFKKTISIWDPYCHYTRDSYITLVELDSHRFKEVIIKISNELPDYSMCRRDVDHVEDPSSLFMRSNNPFWVISESPVNVTIRTKKR